MNMGSGTFTPIEAGVGTGEPAPRGWRTVAECDCLVLVGLTGAGKSTVLAEMQTLLPVYTLLPDRRKLTDLLMIPAIQMEEGAPVEPVTDRSVRFDYTRRYRQRFPGGMAHALSQLWLSPEVAGGLVIFDGLRGENEVRHAAGLMPAARFLMLDAADAVRIRRLVSRRDSFDKTTVSPAPAMEALSLAALGVAELAELLSADEQAALLEWVRTGQVTATEFAAKARIVLDERRNYDPAATRSALALCASDRTLRVDTDMVPPEKIARRAVRWLSK